MAGLDAATINAVLQKQGAPNTTENLNRIAQFAAANPDMLARYLGQGTDNSMAGSTDGAIDKSIASVENLGQLAGPNPYKVDVDPVTGRTNIGPGLVMTPEPTGGNGGPRRAGGIPGDFNAPVGAPPFSTNGAPPSAGGGTTIGYEPSTGAPMPVLSGNEHNGVGTDNGPSPSVMFGLLASVIGVEAAIRAMGGRPPGAAGPVNMPQAPGTTPNTAPPGPTARPRAGSVPQSGAPTPNAAGRGAGAGGAGSANVPIPPGGAPSPISPDAVRPNVQAPLPGSPAVPLSDPNRSSPAGVPSGQSQADIDRLKAQVAAENDADALKEQMKANTTRKPAKTKAQLDAEDLARRGRNATGRRS